MVGVCFESVPRWVSLAFRQRLVESGIGELGGTDVSLFRHLLTRTREPDRLRICSYRLRRQLRVDIVPVFSLTKIGGSFGGGTGKPGSLFSVEFRKALRNPSLVKSIGF